MSAIIVKQFCTKLIKFPTRFKLLPETLQFRQNKVKVSHPFVRKISNSAGNKISFPKRKIKETTQTRVHFSSDSCRKFQQDCVVLPLSIPLPNQIQRWILFYLLLLQPIVVWSFAVVVGGKPAEKPLLFCGMNQRLLCSSSSKRCNLQKNVSASSRGKIRDFSGCFFLFEIKEEGLRGQQVDFFGFFLS